MPEQLSSFVANRIAELRTASTMTLDELSCNSGVSKAMISRIERNEVGVTIQTLSKISEALGVSISDLLNQDDVEKKFHLQKIVDQPVLQDKGGCFVRRTLSPTFATRSVEFVWNELCKGGETSVFPPHRQGVEEHIFVTEGRLVAQIGTDMITIDKGECLYFEASVEHSFRNETDAPVVWLLVMSAGRLLNN